MQNICNRFVFSLTIKVVFEFIVDFPPAFIFVLAGIPRCRISLLGDLREPNLHIWKAEKDCFEVESQETHEYEPSEI